MVKISRALSAEGVIAYHREEYAANYENYYSESGNATGMWFGKEALAFGLEPGSPVAEQHFARLANGQDPHSGLQRIAWRPAPAEREPRWMHDENAWRAHLERLVGDAVANGREVLREHADGPKLPKHKVQSGEKVGFPAEHSDREKALLKMHAIARETFLAHLESDAGAGARQYIRERGIRLDTAKEFGLGLSDDSGKQLVEKLRPYGPELMEASGLFVQRGHELVDRFRGRLMIPIENSAGETIAFAGRKPPNENGPKYINSPGNGALQEKRRAVPSASRCYAHCGNWSGRGGRRLPGCDGRLSGGPAQRGGGFRNGPERSPGVHACRRRQDSNTAFRWRRCRPARDREAYREAARGRHERSGVDLPGDPAQWIARNGMKEYHKQIRDVPPLVSSLSDRAREKFDVTDTYGRIDAMKWLISMLEHVRPEQRAQMIAELEEYLKLPKVEPEEVKQTKEPVQHRAAWDITFSAPKTVSLTALVGGDTRVVSAHEEAVWEGMQYFERAIQVKMGGLNAPQDTGRMVAALFRHDTARPVEGYAAPQLHTHAVVFNLSQDRDGQYRALNPRELFYLQGAAEAVYQNHLAVRLKAMGYELEYGKNLAIEVKGYPDAYRQAESPRAAQVEAEQKRLGQYGPAAHQNIALNTRAAKINLTSDEVRALHLEHAEKYGNQPQEVVKTARAHVRVIDSPEYRGELADEAIQFARHRLSERTTVMEWHEIHRDALRFGRGYITLPDVEQAFSRARHRGEFHRVEHWRGHAPESRYTTPELEAKEREILAWMANGRGRAGAIAGSITRDAFREEFRDHLNDGQKWLVWNVIHSDDRMVGVQGLAGTGKTRALATVQQFAEEYGYEVRGVAATSGAVAELRAVGIQADTLAAFALSKEKPLRPRTYLLDEASLTDVHQMSEFLRRLKPADRVVVIGDTRQHGSLGAGRMFAELQEAGGQAWVFGALFGIL